MPFSQGSSGGGLFNADGELVGITTFYLKDGQSLNFALPVEWIGEVAGKKIRERPRVEVPVAPGPGARPKEEYRPGVAREAREWPSLLADALRWTQAEPGNPAAWYNLGNTYGIRWRYAEAIKAYREALRLKPDYADAWHNLALFYDASRNRSAALEALQQLRRLDPQKADELYDKMIRP